MLNQDKYKTPDERNYAFNEWCFNRDCESCGLKSHHFDCGAGCQFYWLAIEAEDEKPEPCYECGGKMVGEKGMWEGHYVCYLRCANCGHSTGSHKDFQSATIMHNRVCRAVEAVKKGDVK